MTPGRAEDEVGEELTLADLPAALAHGGRSAPESPERVFRPPGWSTWIDEWATFYAGLRKVTFFARIRNGKLFDDLNHQIHVCRYKGEV